MSAILRVTPGQSCDTDLQLDGLASCFLLGVYMKDGVHYYQTGFVCPPDRDSPHGARWGRRRVKVKSVSDVSNGRRELECVGLRHTSVSVVHLWEVSMQGTNTERLLPI